MDKQKPLYALKTDGILRGLFHELFILKSYKNASERYYSVFSRVAVVGLRQPVSLLHPDEQGRKGR